ncbi:MAG: acylphosphatase [Proteobacteria bacterium]|nr:acylphosphatase [Pseudomonadota bacterium]
MPCVRFFVRGRVQGVCFRASTRDEALRLGISGHARNLADGSVEVLACGPDAALEELHRWLHHGPPSARVERVACEAWPDQVIQGFTTR